MRKKSNWKIFLEKASEIDEYFADEELVKDILVTGGFVGFSVDKFTEYLAHLAKHLDEIRLGEFSLRVRCEICHSALKTEYEGIFPIKRICFLHRDHTTSIDYDSFISDAKKISPMFSYLIIISRVLKTYDFSYYRKEDHDLALENLIDYIDNVLHLQDKRHWGIICPIHNCPTVPDDTLKKIYKRELVGWSCTIGGTRCFHESHWAPIIDKLKERRSEMENKILCEQKRIK